MKFSLSRFVTLLLVCAAFTSCRTSPDKGPIASELAGAKTAQGMQIDNWCHFKRVTTDNDKINIDFKIQRRRGPDSAEDFVVGPLWLNYYPHNIRSNDEVRADIVRMEYFHQNGEGRAEKNGQWRVSMGFDSDQSKFTGKAIDTISVLTTKSGARQYVAYSDVSFRVNEKFLVDKETGRDEFKVNFIDIASDKANCD